jgi:fumarate reductase flavoprotein subunit
VHGANRLGGNGVANSTVFGAVAGDVMAAWVGRRPFAPPGEIDAAIARCDRPCERMASGSLEPLRDRLYDVMWEKVGIIRDAKGLEEASRELVALETALDAHGLADHNRAFNLTWHDWMNLKSLVAVSRAITAAAAARHDSRGAHFRSDFPDSGPLEQSAFTSIGADLEVGLKPVVFTRVRPGHTLLRNVA